MTCLQLAIFTVCSVMTVDEKILLISTARKRLRLDISMLGDKNAYLFVN